MDSTMKEAHLLRINLFLMFEIGERRCLLRIRAFPITRFIRAMLYKHLWIEQAISTLLIDWIR